MADVSYTGVVGCLEQGKEETKKDGVGVGKRWVGRWKMLACENKFSATAADTYNLFCDVMDVVFHKCLSQQYSLCPKIIFSFACQ